LILFIRIIFISVIMNWFYPTCKKCGERSDRLIHVSPVCRGIKTIETGIENPYHFFGNITINKHNDNDKCNICIIN